MKSQSITALLAALLTACSGGSSTPPAGGPGAPSAPSPAGPVSSLGDLPDPFVLADGAGYMLYATNGQGKHVQALHSADLRSWRVLPDAMPELASWVRPVDARVWAPEVIKVGERHLLYYTARSAALERQCIGVAVASSAQGPFRDSAGAPLVCQSAEGGTIDASPFAANGRLYLYFKSDGNCCAQPTHLYGQELRADGLALLGAPVRLLTNGRPWEGAVVEAPSMTLRDGRYLLFYSGNDYGGAAYAVGYAGCSTPLGPCTPAPESPILKSRPGLIGPGHQALFQAGGQSMIAYHAWQELAGGQRGQQRFLYIDKLDWVDGQPVVRGPTLVP